MIPARRPFTASRRDPASRFWSKSDCVTVSRNPGGKGRGEQLNFRRFRMRINRPVLLTAIGLVMAVATVLTSGAIARKTASPESEIRAVLDAQAAAWNAGKLEDFMKGYWRSPELTFFSGGRKLSGWDATLERYRKTYQAEGREMGRLAFSDLDITPLGRDGAVVRGRWELTMSDGKKPGGLYTLVFRRFGDGWKIIHDHTSSNQYPRPRQLRPQTRRQTPRG